MVFEDIAKSRRWLRFSLETKLIVIVTSALWLIGGVAFFWRERSNPLTLAGEVWHVQLADTFFHSIAARTAGFVTLPVGNMTEDTTFLTMVLMAHWRSPGIDSGWDKGNDVCRSRSDNLGGNARSIAHHNSATQDPG